MPNTNRLSVALMRPCLFLLAVLLLAGDAWSAEREIPITEQVYTDRPFELRMIQAIRDYVPHVMHADGTPGLNLALGYRGRLIWEAGFGYADVAAKKKMTPETVYHSGSLGKTYTATAIMHLVDRGVIGVDDPINRHLPFEVKNPLGDRDITVRDLMVHRSGLNGGGADGVWVKPVPLAQALEETFSRETLPIFAETQPLWAAKVGEKFIYSNPGLATLGLIVETVNPDKLSFADYVQKYVMDPLGMESSQYPPAQHADYVRPDIWENMSTGYARMGSAWIPTIPLYFAHYAAGGVLAKPADHLRLLMAMMNEGSYNDYQVLKPETVQAMLTPQFDEEIGPDSNRGLVWSLLDVGKPTMSFSHAGGHMFGWRTDGYGWPAFNVTLMVAANQWSIPDGSLGTAIIPRFVKEWLILQPPDVDVRPASDEWTWKVSYVRGAVYAAMFEMFLGIPGDMPQQAIDQAIEETRMWPDQRDDWDAEAFRQGLRDIRLAGFGMEDVKRFWSSEVSKVSVADAQEILREMGNRIPGTSSMLFPAADASGD